MQYISSVWSYKWKAVLEAQKDVLNWLFAVNAGGAAGTLAYASAKESTLPLVFSLYFFSSAVILMIGYAALYYYSESRMFYCFKNDVMDFRNDKFNIDEVIKRENTRPDKYQFCEYLAWLSALAGGLGIVFAAFAIL